MPAKLNGIDWAGDPYASVPCAQRQLDRIVALARRGRLRSGRCAVEQPQPV